MEDRVAVEAAVHVVEEVLDGERGFLGVELQGDDAFVGMQFYHFHFSFGCGCRCGLRGQDTESDQQDCENDTDQFHLRSPLINPNFVAIQR